jgi:hypothetical protein
MTEFEAYQIYHGIKAHFTSTYDFTKYNGKTLYATVERFKKEPKHYWMKFSKKYPQSFKYYVIAAFLNSKPKHIKELDTEIYLCYYNTLMKNTSNLAVTFQHDLERFQNKTFKEVINERSCLTEFSNETKMILDKVLNISKKYDLPKIVKYGKFFVLDDLSEFSKLIRKTYPKLS